MKKCSLPASPAERLSAHCNLVRSHLIFKKTHFRRHCQPFPTLQPQPNARGKNQFVKQQPQAGRPNLRRPLLRRRLFPLGHHVFSRCETKIPQLVLGPASRGGGPGGVPACLEFILEILSPVQELPRQSAWLGRSNQVDLIETGEIANDAQAPGTSLEEKCINFNKQIQTEAQAQRFRLSLFDPLD